MRERGTTIALVAVACCLGALLQLPNALPVVLGLSVATTTSAGLLPAVDWLASIAHGLVVAIVSTAVGTWIAMSLRHARNAPWGAIGLWLILAALVPLSLLAQCLALIVRLTDGVGRDALLLIGHFLAFCPIPFVIMYRRARQDGDAHYSSLRNFGASKPAALGMLVRYQYITHFIIALVLVFFVSLNESAIAGTLGGNTAYFGSVMNSLALGSTDPAAFVFGAIVEIIPLLLVLAITAYRSERRI